MGDFPAALEHAIAEIRQHLADADARDELPPAEFHPGIADPRRLVGMPDGYAGFLRAADGATIDFGHVRLYGSDTLFHPDRPELNAGARHIGEHLPPLPDGQEAWFCFGEIEQTPLLMHRQSGRIGTFDERIVWYTDDTGELFIDDLAQDFETFFFDFIIEPALPEDEDDLWGPRSEWQNFIDGFRGALLPEGWADDQ